MAMIGKKTMCTRVCKFEGKTFTCIGNQYFS